MMRQNVNRRFSERMRAACPELFKPEEALQLSDEAGSTGI
jgi:hypothetical protein